MSFTIAPFEEVVKRFRAGEMVIIVDDADRENEGDVTLATECVTPELINFMMREARGLICVTIAPELAEKLQLPLQVINNNSPFNTPFAVSVDHRSVLGRGVTAEARAVTMRKIIEPGATMGDFVSPGHVFPLVANPAGVIGRQGQTEGSYDLARIAGLAPSGIICEILNPDGTMARGEMLQAFADKHGMLITSIEEIMRYRVNEEVLVREVSKRVLETDHGTFMTHVFQDDVDGKEHLALVRGDLVGRADPRGPLVRIHSECLTGDVFGSRRCDCGAQLDQAMNRIAAEDGGIVLYLRQEGRGIGLVNKLRAYELQDRGRDTVDANLELGFEADSRDFAVAAKILSGFGLKKIRLLTNNPQKFQQLSTFGIEITERIPVVVPEDEYSKGYIETKRRKMGHWL
ncbi:MAG: hypothetical protein RL417_279 [Pseudomonadota bacterium]